MGKKLNLPDKFVAARIILLDSEKGITVRFDESYRSSQRSYPIGRFEINDDTINRQYVSSLKLGQIVGAMRAQTGEDKGWVSINALYVAREPQNFLETLLGPRPLIISSKGIKVG